MSMTREEARIELQAMKDTFEEYEPGGLRCQMALKVAISALRPISREAWTAEWTVDEVGHKCSKCGEYLPDGEDVRKPQFCPECGRAMTPEAWAELGKRMGVRV